MGAVPLDEPGHALEAPEGLPGASFYLDEASVTGTETALLAAVGRDGANRDPSRRDGAARRRVVPVPAGDGRRHRGRGTPTLRVEAPARLRGAEHRLAGDYIEAGSWGVVAAITGGDIEVTGARARDIEVVSAPLEKDGPEVRVR